MLTSHRIGVWSGVHCGAFLAALSVPHFNVLAPSGMPCTICTAGTEIAISALHENRRKGTFGKALFQAMAAFKGKGQGV